MHGRLAIAPAALMGTLLVVLLYPRIQVGLEFLQRSIDLLPKRYAVELVQHRFVEPFTDPVGLGMLRLGARVIDVFHGEVQFVLMALRGPTVFHAAIGEHAVQRNVVLLTRSQCLSRGL